MKQDQSYDLYLIWCITLLEDFLTALVIGQSPFVLLLKKYFALKETTNLLQLVYNTINTKFKDIYLLLITFFEKNTYIEA